MCPANIISLTERMSLNFFSYNKFENSSLLKISTLYNNEQRKNVLTRVAVNENLENLKFWKKSPKKCFQFFLELK